MKCPKCDVDMQSQMDRGVEVEACPSCQGMWLTPNELDQLENEAFNEPNKGSLYLVSQETQLKCPVCSAALRQFDYRFYDLKMDCCPEHGFWLEKDEDRRVLELMREEERRLERKFTAEDLWSKHMNRLLSPSFFTKIRELFR